jgi:hypothetical protein
MEASALRLIALAVCLAALTLGGFAAGRATTGDQGGDPPEALPAVRPAPIAPRLPPAVGIPKLKTRPEEVRTFNP